MIEIKSKEEQKELVEFTCNRVREILDKRAPALSAVINDMELDVLVAAVYLPNQNTKRHLIAKINPESHKL